MNASTDYDDIDTEKSIIELEENKYYMITKLDDSITSDNHIQCWKNIGWKGETEFDKQPKNGDIFLTMSIDKTCQYSSTIII